MQDNKVFKSRVSGKLAIAQVIDSTDTGGAERIAIQLANRFAASGLVSHLLVTRKLGALREQIDPAVHLFVLNRHHTIEFKAVRQALSYIRMQNIQILHAHSKTSAYWCVVWNRIGNLRARIVFHDHTGSYALLSPWQRRVDEFFDRIVLKSVHGVVGVSAHHVDRDRRLLSSFGIPAILVHNGINLADFGCHRQSLNGLCIIQTANVTPKKGHLHVADIGAHLDRLVEGFKWLCIGSLADQKYFLQIARRLAEKNLQNKVYFLGMRTGVRSLLARATVGVLTSDDEGMPLALLEYMAAGLPVVVTAVGECSRVVEAAGCGFVIPCGKPVEFAEAIAWLVNNPEQAKAMGERGREAVEKYYSLDLVPAHILDFYGRILEQEKC